MNSEFVLHTSTPWFRAELSSTQNLSPGTNLGLNNQEVCSVFPFDFKIGLKYWTENRPNAAECSVDWYVVQGASRQPCHHRELSH